MKKGLFSEVGVYEHNPKWQAAIQRNREIYRRPDDIRSDFLRDYNRLLHCTAYRRLKHKTQVFFATRNDHICTRIEHVSHVASVSYTIARFLGLNTELTSAMAIGHDLGHAPFGHTGEEILRKIAQANLGDTFWHEKNSLRFVDKCETLTDPAGVEQNLNLTYAVRDGIICHCGEVDEHSLYPRDEAVALEHIEKANQLPPYTWEGCVVKIADKISYLGRDIEDALTLRILSDSQVKELAAICKETVDAKITEINNTVLMHDYIIDLCRSSSPERGITFSPEYFEFITALKKFNYDNIYRHPRLANYKQYAELVIESVYAALRERYRGTGTLTELNRCREIYPVLTATFADWLWKYSDLNNRLDEGNRFQNEILYCLSDERDYCLAIIDFISGMTDSFAIKLFNEITTF